MYSVTEQKICNLWIAKKDKDCPTLGHYVSWNREIREKWAEKYSENSQGKERGNRHG